jgi:hypothetical protein
MPESGRVSSAPMPTWIAPGRRSRSGVIDLRVSKLDSYSGDWYKDPAASGTDVANLTESDYRVLKGGYFSLDAAAGLRAAHYYGGAAAPGAVPANSYGAIGGRCVRNP